MHDYYHQDQFKVIQQPAEPHDPRHFPEHRSTEHEQHHGHHGNKHEEGHHKHDEDHGHHKHDASNKQEEHHHHHGKRTFSSFFGNFNYEFYLGHKKVVPSG